MPETTIEPSPRFSVEKVIFREEKKKKGFKRFFIPFLITFGISSILIDTGNESPSHMTIAVDNSEMLTYMRRNQNKSENIRMNQMALIEMKSSEIK